MGDNVYQQCSPLLLRARRDLRRVSSQPSAKKTAGQIEKETMNNRMTNDG
jgi:hypothetical protein